MNPLDIAPHIAHLPQMHFIGGADATITPGVYHSFRQAMGASSCIQYSLIQDADHTLGWVEKWPSLLKVTPKCSAPLTEDPAPSPAQLSYEPPLPGSRNYDKGYSKK